MSARREAVFLYVFHCLRGHKVCVSKMHMPVLAEATRLAIETFS